MPQREKFHQVIVRLTMIIMFKNPGSDIIVIKNKGKQTL